MERGAADPQKSPDRRTNHERSQKRPDLHRCRSASAFSIAWSTRDSGRDRKEAEMITTGTEKIQQPADERKYRNRREWGRDRDVAEIFSLKKGTLRTLEKQGKIRSVLLKVSGDKSKIRLWDLDSVRELLASSIENPNGGNQPPKSSN